MASPAVDSVLCKRTAEEACLNGISPPKEEPVTGEHTAVEITAENHEDIEEDAEPLFQLDDDDDTCDQGENVDLPNPAEKPTESEAAADLERLEKMAPSGDNDETKNDGEDPEAVKDGEGGEGVGCSEGETEGNSQRSPKKPRLVWTSELHARFMNAVNHLGIKNAVPTTILKLMNVEGMTRENVASHLQKYRLYVKRMAGLPPGARLPSDAFMLHGSGLTHASPLHSGLLPATSAMSVPVYMRQPPAFLSSYQPRPSMSSGVTTVRQILPAPYFSSSQAVPQYMQTMSPYQANPTTMVVSGHPHSMPPPATVLMRSYSATTPLASQAQTIMPMSTAMGVPVTSTAMSPYYQQHLQIATGVPPNSSMPTQQLQLYPPYASQAFSGQPACVSSSWTPSVTCNNETVTGSPAIQSSQAAPIGIPVMQGRPLTHVHSAPVMHTGSPVTYQSWAPAPSTLQPIQVMGAPAAQMMHQANDVEGLHVTSTAPPPVPPNPIPSDACMPVSQPTTLSAYPAPLHTTPTSSMNNGFELQSSFVPLAAEGNECASSTDGLPVDLSLVDEKPEIEGMEDRDRSTLTLGDPDDATVWSHGWGQDWGGEPSHGRAL